MSEPLQDGISAKTRAEMYGGAASIGGTKESVDKFPSPELHAKLMLVT